ncbi:MULTISPECIES: hypothetical protein [Xenorhabdus]|nr:MULTISPECIES: hypothetical protein [Xenorhabdus]
MGILRTDLHTFAILGYLEETPSTLWHKFALKLKELCLPTGKAE